MQGGSPLQHAGTGASISRRPFPGIIRELRVLLSRELVAKGLKRFIGCKGAFAVVRLA